MNNINQKEVVTLELTEEIVETMQGFDAGQISWVKGEVSIALGNRRNQQDSAFFTATEESKRAFAIVCDGMGGLRGGEIASGLAVDIFVEDYAIAKDFLDNYYYFFEETVKKIDEMIAELKDPDGNYLDAGTTLAAISLQDNLLQWISVGDSKIYVVRGQDMISLAKEHNYLTMLNEQLLAGKISQAEYAAEQGKGAALTSYVGMGNIELMEMNYEPFRLQAQDIIILCSDGLYKGVTEEEILQILDNNGRDIPASIEALQKKVEDSCKGFQDNTTIIMLQYLS